MNLLIMRNKKVMISIVIIFIVFIVMCITIYMLNKIKSTSNSIENVIEIIKEIKNESTTQIPEAYLKDEEKLEKQEVEDEGFELQGEIAYNGTLEIPSIKLGEYAGLTYYSQIDNRWKNLPYTSTNNPTQTMGSSACGPTCAAMIVSSIKGNILPTEMADLYVKYGFRSVNNGTYWSAFRWTADVFDIEYTEKYKLNDVVELLKNNYMVIAACGNGLFTTGGHFIVIYGIEGNTLKIYDPYLYSGKFNTSTRRGKVTVSGNTVYCSIDNFRDYANYTGFFGFKNDREDIKENTNTNVSISTYTRYVKVNTSLNVRNGAGINYSFIRSLYNGDKVTIYEEEGNWSRIGENEWVCSTYLTDNNIAERNTVGEYRKLKSTTTLYSKSNLSGIRYTYLKSTRVKILENLSGNVDRIYIPATRKICICKYISIFR